MTYKVFVEEAAVEFMVGTKNPSRAKLRSFLGQLADDPFNQGDFEEIDALGRQTYTKLIGSIAVSFYPDHAVREVKVFQISPADQ